MPQSISTSCSGRTGNGDAGNCSQQTLPTNGSLAWPQSCGAPYMWRGTESEASSSMPLEATVASFFGSFNPYPVDRFFIIMPPAPSSHHARPLQPTPQLSQVQLEPCSQEVLASQVGDASQPHSRSPRSKGRNFTPNEECQLCRSVLHVSQDPRVRNG